jgi:hypothetical protein
VAFASQDQEIKYQKNYKRNIENQPVIETPERHRFTPLRDWRGFVDFVGARNRQLNHR